MRKDVDYMVSFQYKITDEAGIHARPAGLLVKEAKQYDVEITLECNGKNSDVKKLMVLMSLGIRKDDIVTVTVEGNDDEAAAQKLEAFFKEKL